MSVESIQNLVNDARGGGAALRIAGRSHWIDAGRPVAATRIAALASHTGIVDYVPGDLTITVRSGTTLREIADVTGAEGQWFPLDPFGSTDGSIGATVATGSFGPLAHRFGSVRDLALGVEFVGGDGKIVRGGGRVVKNVAGFDLVRLITGSWGTLGVITETTLRLYGAEVNPTTLVLTAPDGMARLAERIRDVLSAPATPYSVELVGAGVARNIGLAARTSLLVRIGGNAAAVASQKDAIARLGGVEAVEPDLWERFRLIDGEETAVVRISALPSRVTDVWGSAARALEPVDGALMHASAGLGIVRCIIPKSANHGVFADIIAAFTDCTVIFERLPRNAWAALSPSVVADRLSQGVKKAFDPENILNPGILGPLM